MKEDNYKYKFLIIIFFILFSTYNLHASDLIVSSITIPQSEINCNDDVQIEFEVCNINIFDALEGEWSVDVKVKDEFGNVYFNETVPGVFLANGSVENPSCVTLQTTGTFNPLNDLDLLLTSGYIVEVDVNYIYDINIENDILISEFFVLCPPASIHGQKFFDLNKNGIADSNEVGLNGVTIKLYDIFGLVDSQKTHSMDLNGDGIIDSITEKGLFWFDSLEAGDYLVDEDVPRGWVKSFPPADGFYTIELLPDQIVDGILFGNYSDSLDFGDLPEPLDSLLPCPTGQCYPTLLPMGAFHAAFGPKLGDLRDIETNGLPTFTADGDDTTGVDDEDGVKYLTFNPGSEGEVEVKVTGAASDFPCWLSAWIDFNADGMLAKSERIINTVIPNAGIHLLKFNVPLDVIRGGAARFRVSTDESSVQLPYGPAIDGEVEDYFSFGLDYGDANEDMQPIDPQFPQGYPVKTNSNGARHVIVPTLRLGDEPLDNEQNGIPSFYSNGDDNDDMEDEYGILYGEGFGIALYQPDPDKPSRNLTIYGAQPGSTVKITPLATQGGLLNLWIDWNRDGDWKDDNEQVFDDQPVISGPTYTTLSFTIPADASLGYTYARYRFSTQIGLEYYGAAPNGEVEDHLLKIDPTITSIVEEKSTIPTRFNLEQNYPNPFNPSTKINFALPSKQFVDLIIYNMLGEVVSHLIHEEIEAGYHEIDFNASRLSAGIYFYKLSAGSFVETKKMILLK